MATFTERLNEAIKIRNISQAELCTRTGIPKSAMSQYCSGAFTPKQERTYLIAKALNVNEAWLLGYDDVPMDRSDGELFKELALKELREKLKIAPDDTAERYNELLTIYLNTISQKFNQTLSATEKEWLNILNKMTQESLDKLQEQAELLLLAQQARADKEAK